MDERFQRSQIFVAPASRRHFYDEVKIEKLPAGRRRYMSPVNS
jgi:hypothetical protein